MNIRKTIKEEMDGLEWMDEVSSNPFIGGDYHVIWADREITSDREVEELFSLINEAGFQRYDSNGEPAPTMSDAFTTIIDNSTKSRESYIRLYIDHMDRKRYGYGTDRELFIEMCEGGTTLDSFKQHNYSNIIGLLPESVDHYLDKVVESCLILTEETKPDMEWDFQEIKQNIDKSKKDITTRGEIMSYLDKFLKKIKRIPSITKKKIIKYVLISFLGIMSINQLTKIVNHVSDEQISVTITPEKKLSVEILNTVEEVESIRTPSQELYNFLKYEEGSIKHKGEPVLTAYDIGDGAITIGWGHAENKRRTEMVANETTIDESEAENLLRSDVEENSRYVNNILNQWEKQGIKPKVTQGMYDAMVSMMFNMGVGNFRKSEFIQLVKQDKLGEAKEKIKTTNVTYAGHTPRREKESQMFGG